MDAAPTSEAIVLLHGLGANPWTMIPLARRLARPGTRIINWGYRSYFGPIELHAAALGRLLLDLDADDTCERIHIVAHSMGGIVARAALAEYRPIKLGRMVMLASPNRGSQVATLLAPWLGRFCPPIRQLATGDDSFVRCLPPPNGLEIGVISAEYDFLVRPEQSRLDIDHAYLHLRSLHSELLIRRDAAEQVRHFLDFGRFDSAVSEVVHSVT